MSSPPPEAPSEERQISTSNAGAASTAPGENNGISTAESDSSPPSMSMQPIAYPGIPMHMYPFPSNLVSNQSPRSKRRQVKNACTNCQKACKKCDDARPCLRCVKYGISEECVDSQRKERKKGVKRGPYKKRDAKSSSSAEDADRATPTPTTQNGNTSAAAPTTAVVQATAQGVTTTTATSPPPPPRMSYVGPVGYPPAFYGQYPPMAQAKPGEGAPGPALYPQIYFAPIPLPSAAALAQGGQEGENGGYPPPQFYPATFFAPFGQPYGPYVMPHMEGMAPAQYAAYQPIYPRPIAMGGPSGEVSRDGRIEGSRNGEALARPDGRSA